MGYPYQGVTAALAKMFPNVFIDMCWSHIISPGAAMHALSDFLDAVPYNKICGFGGDYAFVDGVYGHLYLARRNISQVLAAKVNAGVFPIDTAIESQNTCCMRIHGGFSRMVHKNAGSYRSNT
jgi:hypothetical protein